MIIFQSLKRQGVRRLMSAVTLTTLFLTLLPSAAAATFSDVLANNRNATAIDFLAQRNIISGYPDGTFKPDKAVSRVEFLKLALLSSSIELDANTPSGFKDIDENAWYAPYLRKAKKEGWVQGYADGTFKPEQSVNKVEGIKMIAEIQDWQIPASFEPPYNDVPKTEWYAPFVAYAKSHNFLEETGKFFIPSGSLSRAKTSEILFRALVTDATASTVYDPALIYKVPDFIPPATTAPSAPSAPTPPPTPAPAPAPAPVNFTPVPYQTQSKTFFDNITLDEDFPNTFYANEFYTFSGKINTGKYDTAFVFVRNDFDQNFENNSDQIENGFFTIPVIFRQPGNYKIGIVPGSVGESKYVQISVLPNLPDPAQTTTTSTVPTNPQVQYMNQKTTFRWNNGLDNLAKITITQGSLTKTFFTRQNSKKFDVIYNDFQIFKPGQISYKIESAKTAQTKPLRIDTPWVGNVPQTFTATEHTFSEIHREFITYNTLPETRSAPGTITFSGKTMTDIYKEAAVIRPDGKVDKIDLNTTAASSTYLGFPIIPNGGDYTFTYQATANGRYIIEINGKDGLATLNTPVYIGNGVPLIPDFFDLENSTLPDTVGTSILINNLLKLINQERNKYGLASVTADTQLNQLAQNHADDMWDRNFFSHVNPDGQTPDNRRLAMGIKTEVGENLARAPNVLYGHNGLMRSAIHRENILDPDWKLVGIGITKTSDDYLLMVEEFSTKPIDAAELVNIKNSMMAQINQSRSSAGTSAINKDSTLESVAENWSSAMATQKFFDFVAPDGSSLSANVQKAVSNRSVQIYILESSSQSQLLKELLESTQVLSASWKTIGIGLKIDDEGSLKLTLLLST